MNKRLTNLGLIPVLIFASFGFLIPFGTSASLSNGAIYSWSETTYSVSEVYIWENEVSEMRYEGWDEYSYSDGSISHCSDDIYGNPLTYVEWKSEGYNKYYSNSVSIMTMTGNFSSDLDLNVYRVDASKGNSLQFMWIALKDAYWDLDMWVLDQESFYNHSYKSYINSSYSWTEKYYDNDTIVNQDIYTHEGWWNNTWVYNTSEPMPGYTSPKMIMHQNIEYNFTMPMILSMQVFRTHRGHYVAWADMFYNYIVYNDTDKNGIYSAGESAPSGGGAGGGGMTASSSGAAGAYTLMVSPEYRGMVMPAVLNGGVKSEAFYAENGSLAQNYTMDLITPPDKTIKELTDNIVFNPPSGTGNDISWSITYPEYPLYGMVTGDSGWVYSAQQISMMGPGLEFIPYAQQSPGNYTYSFDYKIQNRRADLDFTVDLPKMTNTSLYNGVQDYGLSIPHYTYFMASRDINQTTKRFRSKPADIFDFKVGGHSAAEINMMNPAKKNYTLHDYPTVGINRMLESKGGTVAKIVTSAAEQNFGPYGGGDLFASIVFSLEDVVGGNPAFSNFTSYYGVETQNYPTWAGRRLVHDPTFTAYYSEDSDEQLVDGFLFVPLVATSTITITLIAKKMRRKRKFE